MHQFKCKIGMLRYVCVVFGIVFLASCGQKRDGNVALGSLIRERVALTATANEIVTALPFKKGDRVKKGDLLVQLYNLRQKAIVDKTLADVAEQEANLIKLQNGARKEDIAAAQATLNDAEASLVFAEKTLARTKDLLASNLTSKAQYDQDVANQKTSEASRNNAREALLKLTNGTRPEDLDSAEASVNAAKAAYEAEKITYDQLSVVATRDGILNNLPWNLGERVSENSPVAVILSGDTPYVRAYIPEPYRAKLKVGSQVTVKVDGVENSFQGTISWISMDSAYTPYYALNEKERSRLVYLADVDLPDSANDLPSGLPAQVVMP
ncbi:HlyD family secretion protein [Shewanella surugensis]|uniref:HlyD family efflux transporter periplasmic adaptor subunit n=1 Tax=Shewanella surugensis TaxID=212020 RepID=A0ABT0LB48_9GAMM|nr:HlyD family efflux transporter periplasmic adaptor subunit [Shewanella surugensis]MCL1124865.1 HlyD family efflux transporter periplasmic adaptor subunit [Shewanella surugensis]